MPLTRRLILAMPALAAAPALAQTADPRMAERGAGRPDAPVTVTEFYSLTCSHCAAFHRNTYPEVKRDLIETGSLRLVWVDFPLDQVALAAACVARSLPAERYEGFIGALLANQDRWAFTRGDPREELAKMAALAGMSRARYDEALADDGLKRAILTQRQTAEKEFNVSATPSFSFRGRKTVNQSGDLPFEKFKQLAEEARRG
ncbi:MAG: Periplasmic thiol:disulfide interchange protein DsbA [uncultured Craurococcus sp.]|uniref:Periplasmic thiol:disulfide interchange protein DsbA n=1 Tax=uncultured Craurococcus sp. TaxID=1135998 RepID=A0A6J4JSA4_9PROT|nr:MAG: Periplasmic thiol:disulfide interchange protein DsbA [uncultured Craurococcus sp.]